MKLKERSVSAGFLCIVAVLIFASEAVWAQDSPLAIDNVPTVAGIFFGMAPDYLGSEDYKFVVAPYFRYQFPKSEQYVLLRATELEANLVNHPWFRIGPKLNYRFGRDDVENNQVDRMRDIDGAIEAGAFVGAQFVDKANPRQRLILSIDFLQDISNEHEGYLISGSIRGWLPLSKKFDATLGVSSTWGSSEYMDTYFGVDIVDSFRSRLRPFSADSGIRDVSIIPGLVMHLTQSWYILGAVRYMRLLGDAEDSPVTKVGDKNQWIAGVGVAYSW